LPVTIGNIGGTSVGSPTSGGGGSASANAATNVNTNCTGGAAGTLPNGITLPATTICPVVNSGNNVGSGNASADGGNIHSSTPSTGGGHNDRKKNKKHSRKKTRR
jgi:hypothetical protein